MNDVLDWRSARVLVTGATGFIGSHLARRLRELGADVHAVSRGRVDNDLTWHVADLTDSEQTSGLIREVAPDAVFHLASAVTGSRLVKVVPETAMANLFAATNLMSAIALEMPSSRLLLAGSIEEPGRGQGDVPTSPYSAAKWSATAYARMFFRLWGLRVSVLRIAMVYGPGQRDVSKLIPYVILELLHGRQPKLTSGDRLIDWVFVDDVVDAFVSSALSHSAIGEVFDIGSGVQTSIRDTVELVATLVEGGPQPLFGAIPDRPMDLPQLADPRRARQLLGWSARTDIEEGLRRTVDWYGAQS